MNDFMQPYNNSGQPQKALPNATAVLVLGIISIVICCCFGTGIILSLIALYLAVKDRKLYHSTPGMYTEKSYSNLNTGRICAIIGIVLSVLFLVMMIYEFSIIGWDAFNDPELLQERLEQLQEESRN